MPPSAPPRVFLHGPFVELAPSVWQITGRHPLPIQRNMVVVRLPDGGLVLHSVVALREDALAELDALGEPRIMLIPHAKHAMDAPFYAARYPGLRVAAPAQSRAELERRYRINVHGTPEEILRDTPIRCLPVEGMYFDESAFVVPLPKGTAIIVNDVLANTGREAPTFVGRLFAVTGVPGGGFGVSRMGRLFTKDRGALSASLRRIAREGSDAVVLTVSHGDAVVGSIVERLEHAVG